MNNSNYHIVLFDGHCNLCSSAVQWIIRHDNNDIFRFASLQSPIAAKLLAHTTIPSLSSMVLISANNYFIESNAVFEVAKLLPFPWSWLGRVGLLLPQGIGNVIYRWVSKNRYRWFGQQKECWVPNPAFQAKFLS